MGVHRTIIRISIAPPKRKPPPPPEWAVGGMPQCFSAQYQWDAWRLVARENRPVSPGTQKFPWCVDCQRSYQLEMLKSQRCEHPEVEFRPDESGLFKEGYVREVA